MSTGNRVARFGRSVIAVVSGFAVVVLFSTGTDFALEKTVFPALATPNAGDALFALALAYRSVFSILGGYTTARLAPDTPQRHAYILAGIGLAAGVAGIFASMHMDLTSRWYPIALAITGPLFTIAGGYLHRPKVA